MTPTTLYTGPSATSGSIDLSDNISNYDFLYIEYFHDGDTSRAKSLLISTNVSGANLDIALFSGGVVFYGVAITFANDVITFGVGRGLALQSNGGFGGWAASNEIKINSVIGFKKVGE